VRAAVAILGAVDNALVPQDEAEPPPRPKAITVIGRIWLVAAIIMFLLAVVDFIVWAVLRPALPTLIEFASRRDPRLRLLAPFVGYYAAAKAIESVFAAAAGVCAYYFLRLRCWARAALEAASWIYLLYLCGFAYFSYRIWRRAMLDPSFAASAQYSPERFARAVGVEVLFMAGLVTMIVFLRSRKLRSAFGGAPAAPEA
jgi:hypothetical protein